MRPIAISTRGGSRPFCATGRGRLCPSTRHARRPRVRRSERSSSSNPSAIPRGAWLLRCRNWRTRSSKSRRVSRRLRPRIAQPRRPRAMMCWPSRSSRPRATTPPRFSLIAPARAPSAPPRPTPQRMRARPPNGEHPRPAVIVVAAIVGRRPTRRRWAPPLGRRRRCRARAPQCSMLPSRRRRDSPVHVQDPPRARRPCRSPRPVSLMASSPLPLRRPLACRRTWRSPQQWRPHPSLPHHRQARSVPTRTMTICAPRHERGGASGCRTRRCIPKAGAAATR